MREFIVFIPIAIVYLSFRVTITPGLPIPDISVLIVFFLAVQRPSVEGVFLAFVLGYIDDIFSGAIVGSSSFSLVIVYTVLCSVSRKMAFTDPLIRGISLFVTYFMKELLVIMVLYFTGIHVGLSLYMLAVGSVTALFSPLFMALFRKAIDVGLLRIERGEL